MAALDLRITAYPGEWAKVASRAGSCVGKAKCSRGVTGGCRLDSTCACEYGHALDVETTRQLKSLGLSSRSRKARLSFAKADRQDTWPWVWVAEERCRVREACIQAGWMFIIASLYWARVISRCRQVHGRWGKRQGHCFSATVVSRAPECLELWMHACAFPVRPVVAHVFSPYGVTLLHILNLFLL
jgi:hypothetical protein